MGRFVQRIGSTFGLVDSPEAEDLREQHEKAQNITKAAEKKAQEKAQAERDDSDSDKVVLGKRKRRTSKAISKAVANTSTASAGLQK